MVVPTSRAAAVPPSPGAVVGGVPVASPNPGGGPGRSRLLWRKLLPKRGRSGAGGSGVKNPGSRGPGHLSIVTHFNLDPPQMYKLLLYAALVSY